MVDTVSKKKKVSTLSMLVEIATEAPKECFRHPYQSEKKSNKRSTMEGNPVVRIHLSDFKWSNFDRNSSYQSIGTSASMQRNNIRIYECIYSRPWVSQTPEAQICIIPSFLTCQNARRKTPRNQTDQRLTKKEKQSNNDP